MADEMLRVTRPGGLMVLSYTLWWGPFGGHETGPWHAFGGEYAAYREGRAMPSDRPFSLARVIANREYRAVIGLVVACGLLYLRSWF